MIIYSCLNMMNLMLPIREKCYVKSIRRLFFVDIFNPNFYEIIMYIPSCCFDGCEYHKRHNKEEKYEPNETHFYHCYPKRFKPFYRCFPKFYQISGNSFQFLVLLIVRLKEKLVCIRVLYKNKLKADNNPH